MNIMRKLRSGGGQSATNTSNSNASGEDDQVNDAIDVAPDSPRTQLSLQHLKKLFNEYTHPKEVLNEAERDFKLYNMLPLFCKVFGSTHANDMSEKFWDILPFCQQVSRLMVSEIRKRASNQSTEAASIAIVKFLEIENCEESSNGWMLLTTLNLLAAGDSSLIQTMTSASVPSTLVKCLYLFFDLPEMSEDEADKEEDGSDFTLRERRILLQKVFVQLLVRLCSYSFPAEELARMDDLTLLFSAITSQCSPQNIIWRKSAAEVLTTLSRHGLSEPVVNYIHSKGCVALCIENMQRAPQPQLALETIEMFVAVFCFLKDSSEVSQVLLDDFRTAQGYVFLVDFLLKLEAERSKYQNTDTNAAIRNLVLMIASLCACGYSELRPSQSQLNPLFQIQGFKMPQVSSAARGTAVRNIHAFQVLQTVFLKSSSSSLCCTIIDAIASVYHSNEVNFFILEPQNTLSQFIERIHLKSALVQAKCFELLELVVFQLHFVPCKELISLSILLKDYQSISCNTLCIRTLLNILRHNHIFKDVYREVGILEIFVGCLVKYYGFLKKHVDEDKSQSFEIQLTVNDDEIENDPNEIFGKLIIESLGILLNGNNNNANVFRESGGAKCIHEMIKFKHNRNHTLGIIRELILSSGGDEDMLFILTTMHSAPPQNLELKMQILKVLLSCLRESHRTRTIFRKVGGFVYVTSVFVSLDGKFSDNKNYADNAGEIMDTLHILHLACQNLSTAMRFEPANAKFFQQEICNTSLCDTLRLLGCFNIATTTTDITRCSNIPNEAAKRYFHSLFIGNPLQPDIDTIAYPASLSFACLVYRFLYDIALDNFDKPNLSGLLSISTQLVPTQSTNQPSKDPRRSIVSSLNLIQPQPEPMIVHPSVVICMLQLLPSVGHNTKNEIALTLQMHLADVLKSLVRSERNQQIMCEAGLAGHLLSMNICKQSLSEEGTALHDPLQYILERLAAQALKPAELREFLRLGSPLCCESPSLEKPYRPGGSVPLTRIKTLVSMTTPRDFRAHASCVLPPFTEFDMFCEGFGCLYLPSVAPQAIGGGSLDGSVIGGIGCGDRIFPPQTGLSFSTWFCVDKFSDPRTDPHCVRLLTLVRTVNAPREENLVCLTVLLSARDKAIIVSTQETIVPHNVGEWEPEAGNDSSARIWCPDLLHEGQWHHLVIVLNRAVLKNSSFSLFLDGNHMHTQRLHYISQNPGASSANLTVANSVYGLIGTPPSWRRHSRLNWKQGVCHLIEDVISAQTVSTIYALGPHYMGSLQAAQLGKQIEPMNPLVSEERVIFGLNAKAMSNLTLAKIRKVYSRADNKAIAKQLGMSSHENATPIRILHNSAGHLAGPARTLGAVVVGYLGTRVFSPNPVSRMIDTVGGCNILLGIIAMAQDVESLYAGVKALTCVVRSNRATQNEMDRKRSYQTLAMFFKKKKNLLNSHILHLTFSLVGTVNSGQQESSAIPNVMAFQDLLCDLEIWHDSPNDLLKSLLEHLLELSSAASSEKKSNIRIMRDLFLVTKLLHILPNINDANTSDIVYSLLSILFGSQPRHLDLLIFGQYIAAKIPLNNIVGEKGLDMPSSEQRDIEVIAEMDSQQKEAIRNIHLRNRSLRLLHALLFTSRNTVNQHLCDDISRILGMDWILLLLQPQIHSSTVILGLRILVVLCANETIIGRFREGVQNGGYLKFTEQVSQSDKGLVFAPQISSTQTPTASGTSLVTTVQSGASQLPAQIASEVKTAVLKIPGFQYLEWLLPQHLEVPEIYFLLTALIMGQPVKNLSGADHTKLDLDRVWSFLWGGAPVSQQSPASPKINYCPEAVCVLLTIVRHIVHAPECPPYDWLVSHPVTIIQVLFSMYHNLPDFMSVMMSADVITALTSVLFPFVQQKEKINSGRNSSSASTPENEPVIITTSHMIEAQSTESSVRKFVIDFLRVIVVDSLSLSTSGKVIPVIDLVLDASPENIGDLSQQIAYQTEIITALMDHLLAADVLVGGEQAALPIVPLLQSHVQNVAPNVFYLTARIVDKMWQNHLQRDPHEIFDFIIKLIGQAKRRSSSLSLEQLHHSLNRIILYLLSRSTETVAEQMAVLEALHKLTTHRLLIFGAGNHELDFFGCLTYCLLQLTNDAKIALDSNTARDRNTTWHVPANTVEQNESRERDMLNQHQGRNLISGAACRVWEELYVGKKPAIEEVFKISLSPPPSNAKAPSLTITRDQVIDLASKLWYNYVDMEKKAATYRVPWELHNQIQSKIQKVTGGLTRLASRSKVMRKDDCSKTKSQIVTKEQAFEWTNINVGLVKDLCDQRYIQHINMNQHTLRYVCQDWLQSERELIRERGLWGPIKSNPLDKWILDTTEGPHRMRKKTMRNEQFYLQYIYRPELEDPENRQMKYKVATSFDSKLYFTYCQLPPRVLCEPIDGSDLQKTEKSQIGSPPQSPTEQLPTLSRAQSEPGNTEGEPENEGEEEVSLISDNQTLLRMLEEQEKISYMFRCARIQGLDTFEGLLLFGKEYCYVIDGFTLIKNREIRDIDSLPSCAYDPILPHCHNNQSRRASSQTMRQCSKFSYEDIREVHKRRYLLQPIALEVFSGDGRNYLLAFQPKVRNKVYQRFMSLATEINDSAQKSVAGQKRNASVEQTSGIFSSLIGETSVTQRWIRGEISNFQYLMHLNTLAGRSYNDLMQYPIFPWILADYDSEELDLTSPRTFRDFSRPMGAQSPERLEQFQKRFTEWEMDIETPPYHYGTHYSSAMIVCSYLVRMEPFTQHFLRLQGGHFDLADRMFHSVREAWFSASKYNMADVKELIPEFFYLPEFLVNANNFDLGSKQNGDTLNHVVLPPWAKQDVREFIRVHRQALECDYVSQNLHQWIDLIFGYKQQGNAAVEAYNVFHHLFYEGNVDIYNIDDPLKKNATIGFINNFGQIPKQLFKKPHPCKKMQSNRHTIIDTSPLIASSTISPQDKLFFHNLDSLKPSLQPIKELKGPVGQIIHPDKSVLAVEQNKVLMAPSYSRYIAWGFADHSLRIGMYDSDRALFVCEAAAVQNTGEILACACPNARTIVTAGTSSVVTIWEFDSRRKSLIVKHSLHGHTDAVTCLAVSPQYNMIVSGSRDGTAIVWDLSQFKFVRQLSDHVGLVVSAVSINDLNGDIATCSSTWLHVWSVNGESLATVNTSIGSSDRMQQILCVAFSTSREWDQQNVVITGSTDGVVRMWSIEYVQVPIVENEKHSESGALSPNNSQNDNSKEPSKMQSASLDEKNTSNTSAAELIKQMSLTTQEDHHSPVKASGSESSLSEACDDSNGSQSTEPKEYTKEENSNERDKDRAESAAQKEVLQIPKPNIMNKRGSLTSAKSLHELKREPLIDEMTPTLDTDGKIGFNDNKSKGDDASTSNAKGIRPSKSETSIIDSFVMVGENEYGIKKSANALREGFFWQRQLVFRSKLTMHTAYDRKDNAEPASITALAVSKDHKVLYVGDARGRIFSWSVVEVNRGMADHWLRDEGADTCVGCHVRFTLYERKHHCRNCGKIFCNRCSNVESEISRLRILKPVRVCQSCYATLRQNSVDSQ